MTSAALASATETAGATAAASATAAAAAAATPESTAAVAAAAADAAAAAANAATAADNARFVPLLFSPVATNLVARGAAAPGDLDAADASIVSAVGCLMLAGVPEARKLGARLVAGITIYQLAVPPEGVSDLHFGDAPASLLASRHRYLSFADAVEAAVEQIHAAGGTRAANHVAHPQHAPLAQLTAFLSQLKRHGAGKIPPYHEFGLVYIFLVFRQSGGDNWVIDAIYTGSAGQADKDCEAAVASRTSTRNRDLGKLGSTDAFTRLLRDLSGEIASGSNSTAGTSRRAFKITCHEFALRVPRGTDLDCLGGANVITLWAEAVLHETFSAFGTLWVNRRHIAIVLNGGFTPGEAAVYGAEGGAFATRCAAACPCARPRRSAAATPSRGALSFRLCRRHFHRVRPRRPRRHGHEV